METCNCDFICPSIGSNLTARPTEGDCKVALAMRIDKGEKNAVRLDGVKVIVLADAPGPMIDGNWKVGLIVISAGGSVLERQTRIIFWS